MPRLTQTELDKKLQATKGWLQVGNALHQKFTLKTFPAAIEFVNRIARTAKRPGTIPTSISATTWWELGSRPTAREASPRSTSRSLSKSTTSRQTCRKDGPPPAVSAPRGGTVGATRCLTD